MATWTLPTLIDALGLTMTTRRVTTNPTMDANMRHWSCTLKWPEAPRDEWMTLRFSQGSAHTEAPTIIDVLNCLASDASGYENARSFDEWAGEYGYDTDSRKAEKTYRAVKLQSDRLKEFLGNQYDVLLWDTESD